MTMTLRPYTIEDYPMLCSWWEGHGVGVLPAGLIHPFSWVVEDGDGVARGFAAVYLDNGGTGFGMIEWVTTNPENSPRETLRALKTLIPFMLTHLTEELDYSHVLFTCRQEGLSRVMQKLGFEVMAREVIHHLHVRK